MQRIILSEEKVPTHPPRHRFERLVGSSLFDGGLSLVGVCMLRAQIVATWLGNPAPRAETRELRAMDGNEH